MDAIDAGLLILTGLNTVVWWCVWRQRRPQWHWAARLWNRLWRHLARLHSAAWPLVWQMPRWAPHRPLRVDVDTRLAAPCALCGDAQHTTQEHIRLPQWELERRAGDHGQPGEDS
jgi:hypothetical protein